MVGSDVFPTKTAPFLGDMITLGRYHFSPRWVFPVSSWNQTNDLQQSLTQCLYHILIRGRPERRLFFFLHGF